MARRLKQDYSRWRPWDIDDWDVLRQVSEKSAAAAIERFKITDRLKVVRLEADVSGIAREYLMTKRGVTMPPPRWYREHITPLLTATEALLEVIRRPVKGTSRLFVEMYTQDQLHRPLRGVPTEPELVEQLLEQFRIVCLICIGANKDKRGPKRELHVEEAVASLSKLWERISGKPVPMSFDTEIHDSKQEFVSHGLLFCQIILQGIDPDVSISQIETALRKIRTRSTKEVSETEHKPWHVAEGVESWQKLWERISGKRMSMNLTKARKTTKRNREMSSKKSTSSAGT